MNNAKVVVVLGAGRSGTSLAMQVLAENGMGVTGLRDDVDTSNLRGDFEDQTITGIQQDILDTLGISPNRPREITRPEVRKISAQLEKLKSYVAQNVAASPTIWGFKDPRSSNMLPIWQIVFREIGVEPRWVLCVRHPGSVVVSMKTHFNRPEQVSELVWLTRNCDSLVHTDGDTFIVHYEDWFLERDVAAGLARKLLAHVSLPATRVDASIGNLISPNLNRSVPAYAPANPLVADFYEALRQVPSGGAVPEAVLRMARRNKSTTEFYLAPVFTTGGSPRNEKIKEQSDEKAQQLARQLAQAQEGLQQARQEIQEQSQKFEKEGAQWKASATELRKLSENLDQELRSERESAAAAAEAHSVALAAIAANRDALCVERDRMLVDLQQQELQHNAYLREIKALHEKARGLSIRLHAPSPEQPPVAAQAATHALAPPSRVAYPGADKKQTPRAKSSSDARNSAESKRAKARRPTPVLTRRARLWRKFRQDPYQYFADSRIAAIRPLRHLF